MLPVGRYSYQYYVTGELEVVADGASLVNLLGDGDLRSHKTGKGTVALEKGEVLVRFRSVPEYHNSGSFGVTWFFNEADTASTLLSATPSASGESPPQGTFRCLTFENPNWWGEPVEVQEVANVYFNLPPRTGKPLLSIECKAILPAGRYSYEYIIAGEVQILVDGNLVVDLLGSGGQKSSKGSVVITEGEVVAKYRQITEYSPVFVVNWLFNGP
jgi:hypothetical protein